MSSVWVPLRLPIRQISTCRPLFKAWSDSDVEQLQRLLQQGLTQRQIALQMTREVRAIAAKAHLLSISDEQGRTPQVHTAKRWTPEEDQKLRTMHEEGLPVSRMCIEFPSRTVGAIKIHIRSLLNEAEWDMSKKKDSRWTDEEKAYAIDALVNKHTDFRTVARKLKRSVPSVRSAYNRMCILGQQRRAPDSCYWTKEDSDKLLQLLRKGLTSRQIASEIPGRSMYAIRHYVCLASEPFHADATAIKRHRADQRDKDMAQIIVLRDSGESWASIHGKFPRRTLGQTKALYYNGRKAASDRSN